MDKVKFAKRNNTITLFDPINGEILIDGKCDCDTPFLLDVSLRNICGFSCPYCYKNKLNSKNMDMKDFKLLLEKMKEAHVFQVAYGGGNPNEHPNFVEILKMTFDNGIVPNYSTNGEGMNDEIIKATSQYCGAVAVSIHNDLFYYNKLIEKLTLAVKKVNLHFVMTNKNSSKIISFLTNPPKWANQINAVVLLRYKNSNNVDISEPIDSEYKKIFSAAKNSIFKVAFDACSYPLIKKYLPEIDCGLYDYCQGGRMSAYIDENLIMSPCSFDKYLDKNNDLHVHSIRDIFLSESFRLRKTEIEKCYVCKQYFGDI